MKPIFPLVGQRGSSWATEAETGDDPSRACVRPFVCRAVLGDGADVQAGQSVRTARSSWVPSVHLPTLTMAVPRRTLTSSWRILPTIRRPTRPMSHLNTPIRTTSEGKSWRAGEENFTPNLAQGSNNRTY